MINKTIVIGALARDCAQSILRNKVRIEGLRKHFANSYVVIIENDSKDNTKQVLKDYSTEYEGITIISKDYNGEYPFNYPGKPLVEGMSCQRIARMSFFRNKLLDYIRENIQSDYTMFIDIDLYEFSVEGLLTAIKNAPSDWGALFANGRSWVQNNNIKKPIKAQYDSFALLFENEDIDEKSINSTNPLVKLWRGFKTDRKVQSTSYYKVLSAFNGIGIYKSHLLKNIKYDIYIPPKWQGYNISICEHIPFNNQISKLSSCYIARDIDVKYYMFKVNGKGLKNFVLRHYPLMYYTLATMLVRK